MIELLKYPDKKDWQKIIKRPAFETASLEKKVSKILQKIKSKGDKAVRKYTKDFDGVKLKSFAVTENEIAEATGLISDE
jgi:histidinol dehydrogenase